MESSKKNQAERLECRRQYDGHVLGLLGEGRGKMGEGEVKMGVGEV